MFSHRRRAGFALFLVAGLLAAMLWVNARLSWLPVSVDLSVSSGSLSPDYFPIVYRGEDLWVLKAHSAAGKGAVLSWQGARNWNRVPFRIGSVFPSDENQTIATVCPSQNLWAAVRGLEPTIQLFRDRSFKSVLFETPNQNIVNVLKPSPINLLSLSPDGKHLAASSHLYSDWGEAKAGFCDLGMTLFDTQSGEQLARQSAFEGGFTDFAWSPDSTEGAGITVDGRVFVLDAATGKLRLQFRAHRLWGAQIAWSPDGKTLVTASNPRVGLSPTRIEFDLKSGTGFMLTSGDKATIGRGKNKLVVAQAANGDTTWNGQTERLLKRFDARTGKPIGAPIPLETGAVDMAFSPDGSQLALGEHEFALLLNARTLATERRLDIPKLPAPNPVPAPVCVAWAPDGATLATSTARGLTLWRTR